MFVNYDPHDGHIVWQTYFNLKFALENLHLNFNLNQPFARRRSGGIKILIVAKLFIAQRT
jgi:hypothetical protein